MELGQILDDEDGSKGRSAEQRGNKGKELVVEQERNKKGRLERRGREVSER